MDKIFRRRRFHSSHFLIFTAAARAQYILSVVIERGTCLKYKH